jgi:hypothetical protein
MKYLMIISLVFASSSAFADDCASELKRNIDFAYNDGGLTITNTVGPINWNEGFQDADGNFGLASLVAYAVSYTIDHEVIPNGKNGNVLISAECIHEESEYLEDKNGDGHFDLNDAVTKGD